MRENKEGVLVAFVGNPNSGKSTIFNNLEAKSNFWLREEEPVGNWAGVTVDSSAKQLFLQNGVFKTLANDGIFNNFSHNSLFKRLVNSVNRGVDAIFSRKGNRAAMHAEKKPITKDFTAEVGQGSVRAANLVKEQEFPKILAENRELNKVPVTFIDLPGVYDIGIDAVDWSNSRNLSDSYADFFFKKKHNLQEFADYFAELKQDMQNDAGAIDSLLTHNFLHHAHCDLIVNVIDAVHLQRGLYLSLQLLALNKPLIVVINRIDMAEKVGLQIDIAGVRSLLQDIPIFLLNAHSSRQLSDFRRNFAKEFLEMLEKYSFTTSLEENKFMEQGAVFASATFDDEEEKPGNTQSNSVPEAFSVQQHDIFPEVAHSQPVARGKNPLDQGGGRAGKFIDSGQSLYQNFLRNIKPVAADLGVAEAELLAKGPSAAHSQNLLRKSKQEQRLYNFFDFFADKFILHDNKFHKIPPLFVISLLNWIEELSSNSDDLAQDKLAETIKSLPLFFWQSKPGNWQFCADQLHEYLAGFLRELLEHDEEFNLLWSEQLYANMLKYMPAIVTKNIKKQQKAEFWQKSLDNILLNRFLALPIFVASMYGVFFTTISWGEKIKNFFESTTDLLLLAGVALVKSFAAPNLVADMLYNGIGVGFKTVAGFMPLMFLLYCALSLLENCGYLGRIALLMDSVMHKLALPGKAAIPLILAFGCNVPAISAARVLEKKAQRIITIMMVPFMSCGARFTVFILFSVLFFKEKASLMVFYLYIIGIVLAITTGILVRAIVFKPGGNNFAAVLADVPEYNWPKLGFILRQSYMRTLAFVRGTSKTIVLVSFLLHCLASFAVITQPKRLIIYGVQDQSKSLLADLGRSSTSFLRYIGINSDNWEAAVSLYTGILAKEVIVGSLTALYSGNKQEILGNNDNYRHKHLNHARAISKIDDYRSEPIDNNVAVMNAGNITQENWQSADEKGAKDNNELLFSAQNAGKQQLKANLPYYWSQWSQMAGVYYDEYFAWLTNIKMWKKMFFGDSEEESEGIFEPEILESLRSKFTVNEAMAYLLFVLIYFPCISVFANIRRELSLTWACVAVMWSSALGYAVSALFFYFAEQFLLTMNMALFFATLIPCAFFLFIALNVVFLRSRFVFKAKNDFS